jgi:hypothetical protein
MENEPYKVYVEYNLPDDEYKVVKTCKRQEEFNKT